MDDEWELHMTRREDSTVAAAEEWWNEDVGAWASLLFFSVDHLPQRLRFSDRKRTIYNLAMI